MGETRDKDETLSWAWWYTPLIPDTWEAETETSKLPRKLHKILSQKL